MIFSFDHDPDEYREDPQATKTHAVIGYARVSTGDLRALSPLKWQHVNPYGTFTLNMNERLPLAQIV
jgi:hypothetical protein